jgi:hypothetical protein
LSFPQNRRRDTVKNPDAAMAHSALAVLLSLSFFAGAAGAAPAASREHALQSLGHGEVQTRRQAAARLGEIGVMADTPALLRALRDADEGTRVQAEQAMWRIWGRSGDARVDTLYRTGVGQMSAGDLHKSIATFSRIIALKPGFAAPRCIF